MSAAAAAEPAIRSYVFGRGYRDLGRTLADCWRRNLASARDQLARANALWPGRRAAKAQAVVRCAAGISIMLSGTACWLLASLVHAAALLSACLLSGLGFSLVYLGERGYLSWKRFFTVCPACHFRQPLPAYLCPRCGAVHRRLVPSPHGILRHTCTCGERLPATLFLRRGALPARCPNPDCGRPLTSSHTEARKLFIAVFGGPSAGKSAYLLSALRQLVEQGVPALGLRSTLFEPEAEAELDPLWQRFDRGLPPGKTPDLLPRALTLRLERPGLEPRVLYLYDPAGETFLGLESLGLHRYLEHLGGLILLVDPFAIPVVQAEYAGQLAAAHDALKPAALPVEDGFARILIGMEEHFGLGVTARLEAPVAVVLTKIDAFDLERHIDDLEPRTDEPEPRRRIQASAGPADPGAVRDQLLRRQLARWGQRDLVQHLETRCARLRYFACSALGRLPDSTARPFAGRGVLEPLLWILACADPAFGKAKRKGA